LKNKTTVSPILFIPCIIKTMQTDKIFDFKRDYLLKNKLGVGQFATTYAVYNLKEEREEAVKIIPKNQISMRDRGNLIREIEIMKLCKHPHIVKYYDCQEDEDTYYIFMEIAKCGDLFDYMDTGELDDNILRRIVSQLISALEYCHSLMIAHRDIKLENVLIFDASPDNFTVKLADFGLSHSIMEDYSKFCGTLEYIPPEIINKDSKFNPLKADIWSLGVLTYCLKTGNFPWKADRESNLLPLYILNLQYTTSSINDPLLSSFLSKILVLEESRYSLRQMKEDPWIKDYVTPSYLPHRRAVKCIDLRYINKISMLGMDPRLTIDNLYKNFTCVETSMYHTLMEKDHKNNKNFLCSLIKNSHSHSEDNLPSSGSSQEEDIDYLLDGMENIREFISQFSACGTTSFLTCIHFRYVRVLIKVGYSLKEIWEGLYSQKSSDLLEFYQILEGKDKGRNPIRKNKSEE